MSGHRVAAEREATAPREAYSHAVDAEQPSTRTGQGAPDPALREDGAEALFQRARREIAETGRASPATAAAFHRAVRSLSDAALHDLISDLDSPGRPGT